MVVPATENTGHTHLTLLARGCTAVRLLCALLIAAPAITLFAQDTPAQFSDLASQAAAARDQKNLPLAIDLYTKAVQANPGWTEGWWYLGLLQYSSDQYAPAIDALNHLLQLQSHNAPAMAMRGLCEFETAAYDDSLRDLEQSIAHGAAAETSHEPILRYHLGLLLTRAGRFYDALNQYRLLATKHDQGPGLPIAIGLAGMRVRNLPGDLNPQDRDLYQIAGKGAYALMAGDSDAAGALFRDAFVRYPTTANLHYFYGFLLFPHDRGLAAEEFRREVEINPSSELSTGMLAFTLMYTGHYAEAIPVAQRAVAAAPGMVIAQLALGRSLIETGDQAHGTEILNQILANDPNNLEAHLGLVAAYSRAGRTEDAYRERMVCLGLVK